MANRSYTLEERQQVLDIYRLKGLNATHRTTKVGKETILRWAAEANVPAPNKNAEHAANGRNGGIEAARRAREVVMTKLEERAMRTLDVHAIALARELQALSAIENPTMADMRFITQARTSAVRDLELILRRIGEPEKEDGAEMLELVKHAFAQALNDARVPLDQQELVRIAFAHRLRVAAAGGEAIRYDTTPEDEEDELVGVAGELEAAEHREGV